MKTFFAASSIVVSLMENAITEFSCKMVGHRFDIKGIENANVAQLRLLRSSSSAKPKIPRDHDPASRKRSNATKHFIEHHRRLI